MRPCYLKMLDTLTFRDEARCVADALMGTSSQFVYLKALEKFCPEYVEILIGATETYEERVLFEVVMNIPLANQGDEEEKPVIFIDAGQRAGIPPVMLAFYIIEQLIACEESNSIITNAKWIILPSVNPDGLEFDRYSTEPWRKNMQPHKSERPINVLGVDISRNFDHKWEQCVDYDLSQYYAGPKSNSEIETQFINDVLQKYRHKVKLYLSLRQDGHSLLYPYGDSATTTIGPNDTIVRVANLVTNRVNQISGSIQAFLNDSIYTITGRPYCGHSVDYAFDMEIPLAYEMRVFMEDEGSLLSSFHTLPLRYTTTLLRGYYRGIIELYNIVSDPNRYDIVF